MGQYYKIVNLDKEEYLRCYDYDCGAKLMESSYITSDLDTNDYMATLSHLIEGEWKGDRVLMVGDYADYSWASEEDRADAKYLCSLADEFHFISEKAEKDIYKALYECDEYGFNKYTNKHFGKLKQYLCNSKTKQYIDLKVLPLDSFWDEDDKVCIYPLPLLISIGNGLGNGDYRGDNVEYVGSWANTSAYIFFDDKKPEGYEEFKPDFV